jgi:hypothetical protein
VTVPGVINFHKFTFEAAPKLRARGDNTDRRNVVIIDISRARKE